MGIINKSSLNFDDIFGDKLVYIKAKELPLDLVIEFHILYETDLWHNFCTLIRKL